MYFVFCTEQSCRGQGFGKEAVLIMMHYGMYTKPHSRTQTLLRRPIVGSGQPYKPEARNLASCLSLTVRYPDSTRPILANQMPLKYRGDQSL